MSEELSKNVIDAAIFEAARHVGITGDQAERFLGTLATCGLSLRSLQSPGLPDGWKAVPEEPTEEMYDGAWQAYHVAAKSDGIMRMFSAHELRAIFKLGYAAMLSAAPPLAAAQGEIHPRWQCLENLLTRCLECYGDIPRSVQQLADNASCMPRGVSAPLPALPEQEGGK